MSTNRTAIRPDLIHLVDVRITKGELKSPVSIDEAQITSYGFDVTLDIGLNLTDSQIRADLTTTVQPLGAANISLDASAAFSLSFYFVVDNLNTLVEEEPAGLRINGGLGNAIASIAYSTARGIMLTRLQGTALKGFILPVIDPNTLLAKKRSD